MLHGRYRIKSKRISRVRLHAMPWLQKGKRKWKGENQKGEGLVLLSGFFFKLGIRFAIYIAIPMRMYMCIFALDLRS